MRIPKPKSAPGLFLWFVTALAMALVGRIAWVLVGQNIENVSTERGYDKLLSRHLSEILGWLAVNGFWLSLTAAAVIGGAIALWVNVLLQPSAETEPEGSGDRETLEEIRGRVFSNEVVQIDGKKFVRCDFRAVRLHYAGGDYDFDHCNFYGRCVAEPGTPGLMGLTTLYLELGILRTGVMTPDGLIERKTKDATQAKQPVRPATEGNGPGRGA